MTTDLVQILEVDPVREYGRQSFTIQPGVHTIEVDARTLKQTAIGELLREVAKRMPKNPIDPVGEVVAVAVGIFDVPLKAIYPENEEIELKQLDDRVLANIVRYRMERAQEKTDD